MRVGILTWHQAINHGAVLQTYSSVKMLESLGYDPVVLEYDWYKKENHNLVGKLKRRAKSFSFRKLIWYSNVKSFFSKKSAAFNQFNASYLPLGQRYDKEPGLDAVYIGSDMVFDIKQGYNPYMYGKGLSTRNVMSYAASFGYTTEESLRESGKWDEVSELLSQFSAIGYRDRNTGNLCEKLAPSVSRTENIDPVLCYGFEKELSKWDTGKWRDENYLLVYAYDSTMNDDATVNMVLEYAKQNKLKVVSCGYYHKWCDECVPADPKEFVEMFKHAESIVTDTFHGTVFSLIFHKKFCTLIQRNAFKSRYLLSQVRLEDRIPDGSIGDVLATEPDFSYCDEWLAERRTFNKQFIGNTLSRFQER